MCVDCECACRKGDYCTVGTNLGSAWSIMCVFKEGGRNWGLWCVAAVD